MAGEHRIVALGAGEDGSRGESTEALDLPIDSALHDGGSAPGESWDSAWVASHEEPEADQGWIAPILAGAVASGWTALFLSAHIDRLLADPPLSEIAYLVSEWCIPVLLIAAVWLLVMRNSAREAVRFGHVARSLAGESQLLEQRLTAVNRELSLAREFMASQSRDLESLGRIAAERLSSNAERLQDLVRENGTRVETLSEVSTAALENMEKLRGQMPVIASSAKDVTNNIANAGRTAHAQLEDMVSGFRRLNEFGTASSQLVGQLKEQVAETLGEFSNQCDHLETLVAGRLGSLGESTQALRAELDRHEAEALAAIRERAAELTGEIEATRARLDTDEAESLTALRARLGALRDESEVVSRSLRDAESRAADSLRQSLASFRGEQAAAIDDLSGAQAASVENLGQRLAQLRAEQAAALRDVETAQRDALAALGDGLDRLAADAERAEAELVQRSRRFATEADERQARQVEQERHAVARIQHMLSELDAAIAERLERHRIQADALGSRAAAVTGEMESFEARLSAIVESSEQSETRISDNVTRLINRLADARTTLTAADHDIGRLTDDSVRLLDLIHATAKQADSALPDALGRSEEKLSRLVDGVGVVAEGLHDALAHSDALAGKVEESAGQLDALALALQQSLARAGETGSEHEALLTRLRAHVEDIAQASEGAAGHAREQLAEALETLRGAIDETVARLETDSAGRIQRVAGALGDESASAIEKVMRTKVAEVSGQLEQAVSHAAGISREATVQLHGQLEKVEELVASLERRVDTAREKAEEQVDNDFARRAALITEALNSASIDIASVLSEEVTDTAWAAYLRGDRGIFTRRAVRLLESGDAKAIQQTFERDDAFREHVSRYIHDFESILRQVLSTRDGNAMGVTLLSSDMGKLYVALAQAIERLRS